VVSFVAWQMQFLLTVTSPVPSLQAVPSLSAASPTATPAAAAAARGAMLMCRRIRGWSSDRPATPRELAVDPMRGAPATPRPTCPPPIRGNAARSTRPRPGAGGFAMRRVSWWWEQSRVLTTALVPPPSPPEKRPRPPRGRPRTCLGCVWEAEDVDIGTCPPMNVFNGATAAGKHPVDCRIIAPFILWG